MTSKTSPSSVPKLRFPEFRDAPPWDSPCGDALFDPINNRNAPSGLPVLAITQEHGAIPRDQIDYHVSVTAESVASYKEVCEGDFIISLRSFQGGIEYSRYHGICSPAYVILRRRGEGNDHFFRHFFKSERFIQQLTRNIEGIRDGKMISYAQFSEQKLSLPKPPEQQKIADCLDSLDDLIAAEGRKLEALRQHKQGLMQQLFPHPGETVPLLRFPEFENGPEWRRQTLGEAATFLNGRAYSKDELLDSGKYRVLRVGNFFTNDHWYYSDLELHDDKYCDAGDLLYAWSASFGPRIWRGERVIYHYHIWKVVERKRIDRGFLYACLECETERMRDASARGLGMQHLTKAGIESWECAIPTHTDEQRRISECLNAAATEIDAQDGLVHALQRHKRGLVQQLFPTGEDSAP
ncbi:MAG: restriction endonuclease subunit S [Phycisphaerales bacterium]|nr:restriction endonuclease subunit S [Phycisphaerales bacterium]